MSFQPLFYIFSTAFLRLFYKLLTGAGGYGLKKNRGDGYGYPAATGNIKVTKRWFRQNISVTPSLD